MDNPATADANREAFLQCLEVVAQAAEACGFTVFPVPLDEYRRSVEADRREDRRLLATGQATPDELQARNSWCRGTVRLLDKSASYK